MNAVHRDAFCQFPIRWIYYCHSSKVHIFWECHKKFCSALIGSFLRLPADVRVRYQTDGVSCLDLLYYNIDDVTYLVQVVNNYPHFNSYTFEVFDVFSDMRCLKKNKLMHKSCKYCSIH